MRLSLEERAARKLLEIERKEGEIHGIEAARIGDLGNKRKQLMLVRNLKELDTLKTELIEIFHSDMRRRDEDDVNAILFSL